MIFVSSTALQIIGFEIDFTMKEKQPVQIQLKGTELYLLNIWLKQDFIIVCMSVNFKTLNVTFSISRNQHHGNGLPLIYNIHLESVEW